MVLLQLPPERPVQVHARHRHAGAVEADQQLHLQGHVPAQSQQPGDRLPEQAQQAAGAARPRPDWCRSKRRAIRRRATTRGSRSGPACSAAACSSTCSPATGTTSSRWIRPTSTASRRTSYPAASIPANNQRTRLSRRATRIRSATSRSSTSNLSYFQDGWHGSHDFKFGYDWKRDRRFFGRAQPFDIHYRDLNSAVNELEIYNSPNTVDQRCGVQRRLHQRHLEVQRSSDLQPRPALRALRRQLPDQVMTPNGLPQLANWPATLNPAERARYLDSSPRVPSRRRTSRARSTCRRGSASRTT